MMTIPTPHSVLFSSAMQHRLSCVNGVFPRNSRYAWLLYVCACVHSWQRLFFLSITQLHFIITLYNEFNKAANKAACVMWPVRNPSQDWTPACWFLSTSDFWATTPRPSSKLPHTWLTAALLPYLKKMFEVTLIFCSLCHKIQSVQKSPLTSHGASPIFFHPAEHEAAPENWSSLQIMPTCLLRPLPGHVRKIYYRSPQFGTQLNGGSEELGTEWRSSCLSFSISVPSEPQNRVHSHALWLLFL